MKSISIIRDRGQLTIPDSIRKIVSWVSPMSAISITVIRPDEIVIKPHQVHFDAKKIWALIHRSRAISGQGKNGAADFLEKDRYSH